MTDEFNVSYMDEFTQLLIRFDAVVRPETTLITGQWSVPNSLETRQCEFKMESAWKEWRRLETDLVSSGDFSASAFTDSHHFAVSFFRGDELVQRSFDGFGSGDCGGKFDFLVDFVFGVRDRICVEAEKPVERECPSCVSKRVVEIEYDLRCVKEIVADSKLFRCLDCDSEFGKVPESLVQWGEEARQREQEGIKRGVMDAKVNQYGFVDCPHCGLTFLITDRNSWDGQKHIRCETWLKLTYPAEGIRPAWYH